MAITPVTLTTKFTEWKDITNELIVAVGDNTGLTTTIKTSLVLALNELDAAIGDLTALSTAIQTDVVSAINETVAELGDVSTLNTTATDAVNAINELLVQIGLLATLNTIDKTTLVNAINEVLAGAGDLTALTTTDKTSTVAAINELDGEHGDLSTLTTTAVATFVGAINELDADVGDLSTLTTTAQGSTVAAMNELQADKLEFPQVEYSNSQQNGGRFATDDMTTVAVTIFDDTGLAVEYNSAVFATGENFVNDNSTFGGAGAALGADVNALLVAMTARTEKRYGYEFYILDITAGAGVADQETYLTVTYNPVVENSEVYLGPIGKTVSFSCWIRLETLDTPTDNGIKLGDTSGLVSTFLDGVAVAQESLLTTAMGWVHLKQTITLTKEFEQFFPAIYANENDVINIALPVFTEADYAGIHLGLVN